MRYSHQRELILSVIRGRCDHPTADMIYSSCREIEPNISLGTVYRNLKLLAEEGLIDTLETTDKKIHYDGDVKVHIHFICEKCGNIVDLFVAPPVPDALSQSDNVVTSGKCVYYGICSSCNK